MAHELDESTGSHAIAYAGKVPWHGLGHKIEADASLEEWQTAARLNFNYIKVQAKYSKVSDGAIPRYDKMQPIRNMAENLKKIIRRDSVAYVSAFLEWEEISNNLNEEDIDGLIKVLDGTNFSEDMVRMNKCFAVTRDDVSSRPYLGHVNSRFKFVQPNQLFEFFSDLVKDQGFRMESAGALRGGSRIWALAKVPQGFTLPGGDRVEAYVMIATGVDGKFATHVGMTSVRVVCNNTYKLALDKKSSSEMKISHNQIFDPTQIKMDLGWVNKELSNYEEEALMLTKTDLTTAEIDRMIKEVYGHRPEYANEFEKKFGREITYDDYEIPERTMRKVKDAIFTSPGSGIESAKPTRIRNASGELVVTSAWGFVNGVTHFEDHVKSESKNSSKLDTAWFGKGRDNKIKAHKTACAFASNCK